MDRCIITSASSKFFPVLLNFLGSISQNYPSHPHVYVYDLGLLKPFRTELESISWVTVLDMPAFVPHWRSCYTWKTYILNTPKETLNLYLDAGCQVLRSLDPLFEETSEKGYVFVSQGPNVLAREVTPTQYVRLLDIPEDALGKEIIAAGIIGFKKESTVTPLLCALYDSGVAGLCLGFSSSEQWKNKGQNRNSFIRDCDKFRHDTTLLTILMRKMLPEAAIHDVREFSDASQTDPAMPQYVWNFRMNFKSLPYLDPKLLHEEVPMLSVMNRKYVSAFIMLKRASNRIKGKLRQI